MLESPERADVADFAGNAAGRADVIILDGV